MFDHIQLIQRHAFDFIEGKLTVGFSVSNVRIELVVKFLYSLEYFW